MANHRFVISPNTSTMLDVIRVISAQLVVMGHIYLLYLSSATELSFGSLIEFAGSLSNEAVIAFFVMSGYLVGGRIVSDIRLSKFNMLRYSTDRLTRLWVVLLPALLVTGGLDYISMNWLSGEQIFALRQPFYPSWYLATEPWSAPTFISNTFFMQTLWKFQFGTNLSLWSIAHEFWYYAIFPCMVGIMYFRRIAKLMALAVVLGIVLMIATSNSALVFAYCFPVWLAGAAASLLQGRLKIAFAVICGAIPSVVLMFSDARIPDGIQRNIVIGMLVIGLILLSDYVRLGWAKKTAHFVSKYSYSLYAIHLPFLFLLLSIGSVSQVKQSLSAHGISMFIAYMLIINIFGYLFWYATERHTHKVRDVFRRVVRVKPSAQGAT